MELEIKVKLTNGGDGETVMSKTYSNFNLTKVIQDGTYYEKVVLAILKAIPEEGFLETNA